MRRTFIALSLVMLCLVLAACNLPKAGDASGPETAGTQAALTVEAIRTTDPSPSPLPQETSTGSTPATASPLPTSTAPAQDTPVPQNTSAPSPTPPACDAADFGGDVTIPDGSIIPAGSKFVKTWRLKNTGTCTWTTAYSIVFVDGTSFGAPAATNLQVTVAPGDSAEISIELTAPNNNGDYRGNFKLRNPSGLVFGTGSNRTAPFYADIKVAAPQSTGNGYSLVDNYCSAEWTTQVGAITCKESNASSKGYVIRTTSPALESGAVDDEPGLITVPATGPNAYIRASFPLLVPQSGDRFRSIVGCEYQATSCRVRFALEYREGSGQIQSLGSWSETYDGSFTNVDVDLSSLAGRNIQFMLVVYSDSGNGGDKALWLKPRIER